MWFKVDDGFHASRKLLAVPKRARFAAAGLWAIAGSWCGDQLTDGHVPEYMLAEWGAPPSAPQALVDCGLWEVEQGGYVFYKWHEYQPSKQDVDAERAASRERMRELRAMRKQKKPQESGDKKESFARTVPNSSESVPNPDPTRPDPTLKEEGKPSSKAKTKDTPIPDNWAPTPAQQERAQERNLNLNHETEAFKLHAETHGRRCVNWNAAFTTWLIKAKPMPTQQTKDIYNPANW